MPSVASARAARAARPAGWLALGLPEYRVYASRKASSTDGSAGVFAE